jgi:hypothetical protein
VIVVYWLTQIIILGCSDVNKDFNAEAKAKTWTLKAKAKT